MIIAFNKPYGVLSQFTDEPGSSFLPLSGFGFPPHVYPVGRLDADSEGLLLLSDEKGLPTHLLHPDAAHARTYWAQVEGVPSATDMAALERGVLVQGQRTRPCRAQILEPQPTLPDREPPIRVRKSIPTTWIALTLTEGRNRQVRRMTAAVGLPTLRLIRVRIGCLRLADLGLGPGQWRVLTDAERRLVFEKTGIPNDGEGEAQHHRDDARPHE